MLTQKEKKMIIDAFKMVDVKELNIDHPDKRMVKWFRFGSYNGMQIASEIVKNLPEAKKKPKAT